MFSKKPYLFFLSLLIVFITSSLYAETSKSSIETQIIEKIALSLFPKQKIVAWGETADQKNIINLSSKMEGVSNPSYANFIIVSKNIPQNLSRNSVIITTEYSLLSKDERVVGAFFWQKGRPNILFLRLRMQNLNVSLGREFDKYIEDEL